MHYDDWKDNFSTLFLNVDFPEDWTGIRFRSKWTKSNSGGLPHKYEQEELERFATNPQFFVRPAYDTEFMFSLTQTGGRLPVEGHYFTYPFKETLQNACCSVFELPEGFEYLESFDKEQLRFLTPIKREKENSGRVNLKAETSYVFVPSLEIAGHKGDFFLSVYFNQAMRDVNIKRVFHPADKQQGKEDVLPTFIPEEAEKLVN